MRTRRSTRNQERLWRELGGKPGLYAVPAHAETRMTADVAAAETPAKTAQPRLKTLFDVAALIHAETGATGSELDAKTLMFAMYYADVLGHKDIGDYFQRRAIEVCRKIEAAEKEGRR